MVREGGPEGDEDFGEVGAAPDLDVDALFQVEQIIPDDELLDFEFVEQDFPEGVTGYEDAGDVGNLVIFIDAGTDGVVGYKILLPAVTYEAMHWSKFSQSWSLFFSDIY